MGCYNGTCMISNLPIMSDEKVKMVILTGDRYGYNTDIVVGKGGYVYSTDILQPTSLPISGEYNYYGFIENIETDWNYELIEKYFKGEFGNVIKNHEEEITDWTLDVLLESIERCGTYNKQLQYKNKQGEWVDCTLSTGMILQDVWNVAVNIESKSEDYNDYWDKSTGFYIDGKTWGKMVFDEAIEKFKKVYTDPVESIRSSFERPLGMEYVFGIRLENSPYITSWKYMEIGKVKKDDDVFLEDLRTRWFELQMVQGFLQNSRIGWMVQPGGGSQDRNWEQKKEFCEEVIKICNKKITEENEY